MKYVGPLLHILSVPILDFWGAYAERGGGGGVVMKEWMQRCVSLRLEWRSRKAFISTVAPYAFNSFFFPEQETERHSRYMIWLILM